MNKSVQWLLFILFALTLISCAQLKRRGEVSAPAPGQGAEEAPVGVDEEFQTLPPQISNQSAKKVGLVLGAGGARTLAYTGLIRAFEKNKITISHIASTGWSSLVAASFALNGEVHDMDWKMYKLEALNLKFGKGFLGFGGNQTSSDLSRYLKDNFSGQRFESAKIPYTCATRSLGASQSLLLSRGAASDVIKRCLPSPPFFKDLNQASSPASLIKLARELRRNGAEIIVFVNVLDGSVLSEPLVREDSSMRFLWGQILENHEVASSLVKNSFHLSLKRYSIFDFSKRKQLEAEGEKQGERIARSLVESYRL